MLECWFSSPLSPLPSFCSPPFPSLPPFPLLPPLLPPSPTKAIAKLTRVMFSRGPVSQRAQKEKRVDNERKDRELKKLRFEMEKVRGGASGDGEV